MVTKAAKSKDASKKRSQQAEHPLPGLTHTCAEIVRWKVFAVDVSLDTLLWGAQ